jgi:hypothetical protein
MAAGQALGFQSYLQASKRTISQSLRRRVPLWLKHFAGRLYWNWRDAGDFVAELTGAIPSHAVRRFLYRKMLGTTIGARSSVHRG